MRWDLNLLAFIFANEKSDRDQTGWKEEGDLFRLQQ
jgi:hypothetical protein